jgi:hypothetical protein
MCAMAQNTSEHQRGARTSENSVKAKFVWAPVYTAQDRQGGQKESRAVLLGGGKIQRTPGLAIIGGH